MSANDIRPQLRLIHCAETIRGGIATYLRELLPLQRETFGAGSVVVVVPDLQKDDLTVPDGVDVITFAQTSNRVRTALSLTKTVLALCRERCPEVVHIHSTFAGAATRPLLRLLHPSVRLVYCPHGWAWDRPMPEWARKATRQLERSLAVLTDRVVCISAYEQRSAIEAGLPPRKLVLARNAVSNEAPAAALLDGESLWPPGTRRLLFVGRFDRQKGVDVLMKALPILGDAFHAVLAGGAVVDGRADLPRLDNVSHFGWASPSQIEALFAEAEILVVPSRWEGFGLVAAEGMRAGLPVVASRVGGLPELIDDGVTGLLVPPDEPGALAAAILRLSAQDIPAMGAAARGRVHTLFAVQRLHEELCAVYALGAPTGAAHRDALRETPAPRP